MVGRPARYEVLLTQGAEQDLEFIHDCCLPRCIAFHRRVPVALADR
jgi:hypothetical protein